MYAVTIAWWMYAGSCSNTWLCSCTSRKNGDPPGRERDRIDEGERSILPLLEQVRAQRDRAAKIVRDHRR